MTIKKISSDGKTVREVKITFNDFEARMICAFLKPAVQAHKGHSCCVDWLLAALDNERAELEAKK